jgi:hypothetical protein
MMAISQHLWSQKTNLSAFLDQIGILSDVRATGDLTQGSDIFQVEEISYHSTVLSKYKVVTSPFYRSGLKCAQP